MPLVIFVQLILFCAKKTIVNASESFWHLPCFVIIMYIQSFLSPIDLEWKLDATFPQFWAQVPSNF